MRIAALWLALGVFATSGLSSALASWTTDSLESGPCKELVLRSQAIGEAGPDQLAPAPAASLGEDPDLEEVDPEDEPLLPRLLGSLHRPGFQTRLFGAESDRLFEFGPRTCPTRGPPSA